MFVIQECLDRFCWRQSRYRKFSDNHVYTSDLRIVLPPNKRLPAPVTIRIISLMVSLTYQFCPLVIGPDVPGCHEVVEVGVHIFGGVRTLTLPPVGVNIRDRSDGERSLGRLRER